MAKKRRRSTPRSTKRPERVSHNARIWLATLSTVVGVATGMFTLRDQVFPGESGTAGAVSVAAYRADVGQVCGELNRAERARRRDDRRLARELPAARRSILAQRDALLDAARRSAARSSHTLAEFAAMTAPTGFVATHRSTSAAWTRNLERVRAYIEQLDRAGNREGLRAAVDQLSRIRSELGRDGQRVNTGLESLGRNRCDIEPPVVTRTITLPSKPKARRAASSRREAENAPPTSPGSRPIEPPQATPIAPPVDQGNEGGLDPRVNTPAPSRPQPTSPAPARPRVNTPSTGGPVSGGGEDG